MQGATYAVQGARYALTVWISAKANHNATSAPAQSLSSHKNTNNKAQDAYALSAVLYRV